LRARLREVLEPKGWLITSKKRQAKAYSVLLDLSFQYCFQLAIHSSSVNLIFESSFVSRLAIHIIHSLYALSDLSLGRDSVSVRSRELDIEKPIRSNSKLPRTTCFIDINELPLDFSVRCEAKPQTVCNPNYTRKWWLKFAF